MRLIVKPEDFVAWFNKAIPDAYRQVTSDDIRLLPECGLIGRYGYYIHLDIETVRAVLQYEQLQQNRQKRDEIRDEDGVIHCSRCGVALTKPKTKRGRPREYCPDCESSRATRRYQKWRRKMKTVSN